MSDKTERILKIALSSLIFATLAFIFVNSALPREESSELSSGVGGFLAMLFPPDTFIGGFLESHLRKIAHFAEYGALGVEVALYLLLFVEQRVRAMAFSPLFALAVAFLDESVQILSGRGPAVTDIWIDLFGFVCLSLFTYAIAYALLLIRRRGAKKSTDKE